MIRSKRRLLLGSLLAAGIFIFSVPVDSAPFGIENETTVIDQGGRRIEAKAGFRRVISLYGAHTENLFSLGADDRISGVSRNEAYPEAALAKPVFSYHDDPEKFLAARPDLVLIRPMIDRGYPQLIRRLEKSGIVVASLQPGSVDEMYRYWKILGVLTGRSDAAEQMVQSFKNSVLRLRLLTESLSEKKRVYFEAIHRKMKTFSPESMAVFALEAAGGINAASDAKPVRGTNIAAYGKERILSHADRIDVYLAQSGAMNRPSVSSIREEPGFTLIKAVRENRVHIIDEMIVSRPTYRLLEGIFEIGSILYPNKFTDGVRGELKVGGETTRRRGDGETR
ncbi:MAG: ABC transporter substrate-binding protein [Desulfobacteraceae bacterium]|nr:MAG: ABC transporter substrate-binding protein [Desulfobacteraceae bacterium]